MYRSDKWTGKETDYVHEIKSKKSLGTCAYDPSSKNVICWGKMKITKRGIEDL